MVDISKKLDKFRKKLLDNPFNTSIIFILISLILVLYFASFRNNLRFFISSDILFLLLRFIISMIIYALYSIFFLHFVMYLPDGKQSFADFLKTVKLMKSSLKIKEILLGLLIGIIVVIGSLFTDFIFDGLEYSFDFNLILGSPNYPNLGYFNFLYHITPALWEELIFRGIIITLLLKKFSTRIVIILNGVIFGIFHLANLSVETGILTLGQVIYNTCFGISLGYLYLKTSNLIPCILAHYANNIISVIMTSTVLVSVYFYSVIFLSLFVLIFRLGIIRLNKMVKMETSATST